MKLPNPFRPRYIRRRALWTVGPYRATTGCDYLAMLMVALIVAGLTWWLSVSILLLDGGG